MTTKHKNPAAVALGKMGKGVKKTLTTTQRAALGARGASALTRWRAANPDWRERLAAICKANNTTQTRATK